MAIELPFAVRPLALSNMATGNAVANRPVTNLGLLDYKGMTWKTSGATSVWARGQFSAGTSPVDFISLVGANAIGATTIRVRLGTSQAQVDGTAPYDSGAVTFINPSITREDGLYSSHLELGSVQNASWWRIDIGSHTGDFEASGLVMGEKITPTHFYDPGWERGIDPLDGIDIYRNGVVGKTDGIVLRTLLFRLAWVTEAEFETDFRPMIEALGNSGISFWCFDPQSDTSRQAKSYLGYFGRAPFGRGAQSRPGTYALDFLIRSLF